MLVQRVSGFEDSPTVRTNMSLATVYKLVFILFYTISTVLWHTANLQTAEVLPIEKLFLG